MTFTIEIGPELEATFRFVVNAAVICAVYTVTLYFIRWRNDR